MTDRTPEDAVRDCYSTWSGSYHADYYGPGAAYPPVHRDILLGLLREHRVRSLLDAGCGPASFLRELDGTGIDRYGFDLTPEMVAEAREVLGPGAKVWEGSVLDPAAFRVPGEPGRRFDAAISIGVLPHVPEGSDVAVLRSLRDAVRPGGLVAVSARNRLFGLFTLNRYSWELFLELVRADDLADRVGDDEQAGLSRALDRLRERFRTDLPPVRGGHADEPGYDEVLSRTHNPFLMRQAAEEAGLADVRVLFFHYHALPPMLEDEVPLLMREASVEMEDPGDWRGHVMASAFIVAGRRA